MSAPTKISDVIVPELFTQYVIDETAKENKLITSGIAVSGNADLRAKIENGGTILNMPSWNELDGVDQVFDDSNPIVTSKITAKVEMATLLLRAHGWSSHELAGALAGSDPQGAIAKQVVKWWQIREQAILTSTLTGVFDSASMSDLVSGDGTAPIDSKLILDSKQLLGDKAGQLTAILMHSAVYTELQKQQLIIYMRDNEANISLPTYLGYNVVVDDNIPVDTTNNIYTSYLFANGSVLREDGVNNMITPTEIDRDSALSTDYLFNRKSMLIHPKGISWVGADKISGTTPTNIELADGTNWNRVVDVKKVGIVQIKHTLS